MDQKAGLLHDIGNYFQLHNNDNTQQCIPLTNIVLLQKDTILNKTCTKIVCNQCIFS